MKTIYRFVKGGFYYDSSKKADIGFNGRLSFKQAETKGRSRQITAAALGFRQSSMRLSIVFWYTAVFGFMRLNGWWVSAVNTYSLFTAGAFFGFSAGVSLRTLCARKRV